MIPSNTLSSVSIEQLELMITSIKSELSVRKQNPKTLKGFRNEYLKYSASQFSEAYIKSIGLSYKHLINYFGSDKMLSDISVKHAEEFIHDLQRSAPLGFKVYWRNLKASFNKAIEWEYISTNPFGKIKMKRHQVTKPTFIDRDELDKIISFENNTVIKALFTTTFLTGLRSNEVVNLRIGNIDWNKAIITIGDDNFTTKSRKQRIIPMCSDLEVTLNEIVSDKSDSQRFIFDKGNGFPYTSEYISKRFKKACRKAGVNERVHFHTLRHSFASQLAQKNVPMIDIKELLGHQNISTTEIYAHTTLSNLKNAVKALIN